MNCIQTLADRRPAAAGTGPYLINVKTIDGDIRTGALGEVNDRTVVLHPPEMPETPVESYLVAVTYFNIDNIVSAWPHD